ncbi:LOB domain-containing protein 23, partial [Mucuna pruriens]
MMSGKCAACKNHKRRCPSNCIFSPYFPGNDPQRFTCVHTIYGTSNVGNMLQFHHIYVKKLQILYILKHNVGFKTLFMDVLELYQQIHETEIALTQIQTQIVCHRLQNPQVKPESNFVVLTPQSSSASESQLPSQFPWFN